ncbi:class I SAM-dependent methyltransferase [Streptomyces brasiliscabiei]|uniref:class I SAM-dependent methyltransferase n=1 Tax=Streptomyces brasiliscabiei TaxID=2736302 RepID=UPI001C0F8CCC|nr:class I SAM-dependent methyltransferase [Streptomyces brasiliscabiei]
MTTAVQRLTADDWDARYSDGWPALVTAKEAERFHRIVQPRPGMTAVDLACGTGKWTRQLAAWSVRVTGYDYSTEALRQAGAAGLRDGLSYARWDIDADPIPPGLTPGSLDLVTCRHALPYLEHARLLTDVGRWLTPSGAFYALVRVAPDAEAADVDRDAEAAGDTPLELPFDRGFTEAQINGLTVGWAHHAMYQLNARNRAIVLRGYGHTAIAPRDAADQTGTLPAPTATLPSLEEAR